VKLKRKQIQMLKEIMGDELLWLSGTEKKGKVEIE